MLQVETLFFGAMLNGLALTTLLFFNAFPQAQRKANVLLGSLVGLLSLTMWNMFVLRSGGKLIYVLDVYLWFTPLLWAPFVYLYVGQLTRQKEATWRRLGLHAAPAAFFGVLQIPLHFVNHTQAGQEWGSALHLATVAIIYPQVGVYAIFSLKLLAAYRANALQQVSNLARINLRWLFAIVIIFSGFLMIDGAFNIPAAIFGSARPFFYDFIIVAEALTVFAIGYFSLRQSELVWGMSIEPEPIIVASKETEKYLGSPIDQTLGQELADEVDRLMKKEKMFLFNELKLSDLAEAVGLSPNHLSQVINQHRNKNFYDYVNAYRAAHAADYLRDHGKTNLTRLSFSSGFNNRASFNKAFKKHTGMTPTEFAKQPSQTYVSVANDPAQIAVSDADV